MNLIVVVYVLTIHWPAVSLSPFPWPPYSLKHIVLKLGQLITLQWPPSIQMKGKVNWWGKLHYCPVLINCHSHSNLQQLPSWSASNHQHGGNTLYRQKDYDFLKAQLMVSIFNNKVFFKLRYVRNLHTVLHSGCTRTGNRTALGPSSPIAGQTHWGNRNWKRHMYPSVHCNTVYNSWDMEAT